MKPHRLLPLVSLVSAMLLLFACVASGTPPQSVQVTSNTTAAPSLPEPTRTPGAPALAEAGSSQATPAPPSPTRAGIVTYSFDLVKDIPYQKDSSDQAQEWHLLDLYLPKNKTDFPVLVWLHGGALKYETKTEGMATMAAKRLATEGIGVVLPSYRLSPSVKYPAYIEDAASAVAWAYQNISTYHGNPKQLFVGGHSSGAYLAAMLGMDERYLKLHQLSPQQIAGVIALSGEMYGDATVWAERGIDITGNKKAIDETTPMFYVRRDAPPFLSMCAEFDEDPKNVCEENQKFIEALSAAGATNAAFQQIAGRTHFTTSMMLAPDDPVVKLILAFMQDAASAR
jgi:acetyl esterase/lipase